MVKYPKWRELGINPFEINFQKIQLKKITGYLPAGNDVIECRVMYNNTQKSVFIKIERSKMADFKTEIKNIELLLKQKSYYKMPKIIESGNIKDKKFIVLEKMAGLRLSEIFNINDDLELKKNYLFNYGKELALIHSIPSNKFNYAKQRAVNDIPILEKYIFNEEIKPYIDFLNKKKPAIEFNTFIHGDFHYANILWTEQKINAVLDWEYSGKGFKEQDIAWACILRPSQTFMDSISDILMFIKGYLSKGTFNKEAFIWCLINGLCHFYLMNKENYEYQNKIIKLLSDLIEDEVNINL